MKTIMNETLNIRTNKKIKSSIEKYSNKLNISKSKIVNDALLNYIEFRLPQLLDLQVAIRAADNGEFASDEEVNIFFKKLLESK